MQWYNGKKQMPQGIGTEVNMSKVVCDVCGTAYAETSNVCPICGTAKTEVARSAEGTGESGSGYAYVKGGRFSQSNVRKHNSGKRELPRTTDAPKPPKANKDENVEEKPQRRKEKPQQEEPEDRQPSNIGLIIVVVVLLLAIISLCAYIAIRYIEMNNNRESTSQSTPATSDGPVQEIPCTGIEIEGVTVHTFNDKSDELMVSVKVQPADTTDLVTWNYDSSIVKVVQSGSQWIIMPVAPGETVVKVSCGAYTDTITITSNITLEPDPTDPTDPTDPSDPTDPTDPEFVLELSKTDITLFYYGETAKIYNGTKDPSEITWYSSDESVATIENGVVSAVSQGNCTVYGAYGDQIVSCLVRCTKDVVEPVEPDYYLYTQYGKLASYDVTISIDETLIFSLRDADGVKITEGVVFSVSDDTYITVDENGRVKGIASTSGVKIYLYIEYEGVVYECRIRVRSSG